MAGRTFRISKPISKPELKTEPPKLRKATKRKREPKPSDDLVKFINPVTNVECYYGDCKSKFIESYDVREHIVKCPTDGSSIKDELTMTPKYHKDGLGFYTLTWKHFYMKCSEVGCNAKVQLREQIKKSIKSYNNALSKSTSDRDESITDYEYENRIRAVFDE